MENNINSNTIVTKISEKAIASLILSILNLCGVGSILGIIFGHLARAEIKKSNGKLTGKTLALIGLIIGYLTLTILILGILSAIIIPKLAH